MSIPQELKKVAHRVILGKSGVAVFCKMVCTIVRSHHPNHATIYA
ncbi:hypothetical protein [Nostoc sp.]